MSLQVQLEVICYWTEGNKGSSLDEMAIFWVNYQFENCRFECFPTMIFFSLTLLPKQNVNLSIYVSDCLLQLLDAGIDNNDDRNHDS